MNKLIAAALASASALAVAAPAIAQDTPPQQAQTSANVPATQPGGSTPQEGSTDQAAQPDAASGDIVVTAQRRAERVTDVPISITVANQAQLERQQVNTVSDLARIAPSLEIQAAPGQNTGGGGYIRGIGTQTFGAGSVASVGIVVDQVSQGNANIGDLFDIARVEVLKGPQGTLFGLTTSAGVINITTNAPDPTQFSARLRTELSNQGTAGSGFGNQIVQGLVNIPLSADAALRISGVGNFRQGPARNAYTNNYNAIDRYGGRARLLWKPTDRLSINLIGDWTKSRAQNGGDFFTFIKTEGPGLIFGQIPDTSGITARLATCGVTVGEGNQSYCTRQTYEERNYNFGGSVQVDYDAGPFTITDITAYRVNKDRGGGAATNVFRADPLVLQVQNGAIHRNLTLFTDEVRISSPANRFFEYTLGTFFSSQRETRTPESLGVTVSPFPGVTIPVAAQIGSDETITDQSLAVFGQGTFHLTPKLRLIGGGRFTSEKLQLDDFVRDINGFISQRISPTVGSWRVGAQYDVAPRTMVYATVSRGFKGGQIAIPSLPSLPYVVQPEIPTAYEAGVKSTLFGGWVMDLNAFYEKIDGFQAQQCVVTNQGVISCTVSNINGVKTRGAELSFFGRVFQGLSLNTGFIWAKATYPTGFIGNDGTNIGGTQLAYAPEYKFTLSGEYEHSLSQAFKGFVAADTVWKSRVRFEQNSLQASTFRPHWMVGARLGARTADDRYSLAVFGRNLFNVHEPVLLQSSFPYDGAANIGAIYGPQSFRQIGLQLDGKF